MERMSHFIENRELIAATFSEQDGQTIKTFYGINELGTNVEKNQEAAKKILGYDENQVKIDS
ncbi:hypothetical protein [Virgibacillus ainsalahensis]